MIGIYFSGTGNTRFCVNYLLGNLNKSAKSYSIEDENAVLKIAETKTIILGYPIYYSNMPKIVYDFITHNSDLWKGKKIYIVSTMALFSGDGAGVAARLLKKYGAIIIGGLHLKMPDCIGDVKLLKKSLDKNRKIVKLTQRKIENAAFQYKAGNPTQEGLSFLYHLAGLFGQRLYFYNKPRKYSDQLKINKNKCVGCGKCVLLCPMKNLSLHNKKAVPSGFCTMCYRCVCNCPQKAITLLGNKVVEQCRIEKYV